MRRILVDLRVFLAAVVVLGVSLTFVSLAYAGVYNDPVEHVVYFQGGAIARVVNYSTIISQQNFTVSGFPSGALLGFNWSWGGVGAGVTILAYSGSSPNGVGAVVCTESGWSGTCSWMADGPTYTVSISQSTSFPSVSSANYTVTAVIQGWYVYSTPAR